MHRPHYREYRVRVRRCWALCVRGITVCGIELDKKRLSSVVNKKQNGRLTENRAKRSETQST